nr:MAG TPA: hypothetical protein [Caudoviricetes sp.]
MNTISLIYKILSAFSCSFSFFIKITRILISFYWSDGNINILICCGMTI